LQVVQPGVQQRDLGRQHRDGRFRDARFGVGGPEVRRGGHGRRRHFDAAAEQGGTADQAGELAHAQRQPPRRAPLAQRIQVPPADQPGARVGQRDAGPAAAAPGGPDRPDALPAVPQAAFVADVPAGRGDLEQQRRPVLRRAAQRLGVGQLVQAVEPAPAPAPGRRVPVIPHARRLGDGPVHLVGPDGQAGEPAARAIRGQHRARQLEPSERAVRTLVAGRPRD
jgi:hypothetical protein